MGIVVKWPRHARASTPSRAAKLVKVSAVTPSDLATSVSRRADQRSAGMLSRCHHLETADDLTARSDASASREGHSSITFWKDDKSAIPIVLGQLVLKRKAKVSRDYGFSLGHTVPMAESETEAEHKQAFMARVAEARMRAGMKQREVAEAMGITQDRYKQYEGGRGDGAGSYLPHALIGRFCLIVRLNPTWLLTGQGSKVPEGLKVVSDEAKPARKPRKARSRKAA